MKRLLSIQVNGSPGLPMLPMYVLQALTNMTISYNIIHDIKIFIMGKYYHVQEVLDHFKGLPYTTALYASLLLSKSQVVNTKIVQCIQCLYEAWGVGTTSLILNECLQELKLKIEDVTGWYNSTLLRTSINSSLSLDIVRILLDNTKDPYNFVNKGTALTFSIEKNRVEITHILLSTVQTGQERRSIVEQIDAISSPINHETKQLIEWFHHDRDHHINEMLSIDVLDEWTYNAYVSSPLPRYIPPSYYPIQEEIVRPIVLSVVLETFSINIK